MELKIPSKLVEALKKVEKVAVLTGAGTSAESGVPTFREAQTGLWSQYDPHQLATPQAFRKDPHLVWQWYAWRRSLVSEAEPNPGHYALARMAELVPQLTLMTQNVDSMHQRAGSSHVIELHGNITRIKCSDCGKIADSYQQTGETPPHCVRCDGLLRPDVVWFGENLAHKALSASISAARECDIFFSIGTSAVVQPAASLPIEALENGAITVEVNPARTPLSSYMDYQLQAPSGVVLPVLLESVWPH